MLDASIDLVRLAESLDVIHDEPAAELPSDYAPHIDTRVMLPPTWTTQPALWERVYEVASGDWPAHDRHLIHRDYHPNNVLWSNGEVTGVVDWVNACRGPRGVDVGHCRVNLAALFGPELAFRFGSDQHPFWDVVSVADGPLTSHSVYPGWLDLGFDLTPAAMHANGEAFAAAALAELE